MDPTSGPPSGTPSGSLYFIGTATTLIRYGDLTILTDPNFLHAGQRAYLGWGLTSKRLTEPARMVDQLPSLDAVLLSHLHGDHWDRNAQRGLDRDTLIVTTPHAARRLQWRGFSRALGLRTWASHDLIRGTERVTITAMPGRHATLPVQRLLPPVMGTMLEFGPVVGPPILRTYISGDTLLIGRGHPARPPRAGPVRPAGRHGVTAPGPVTVRRHRAASPCEAPARACYPCPPVSSPGLTGISRIRPSRRDAGGKTGAAEQQPWRAAPTSFGATLVYPPTAPN